MENETNIPAENVAAEAQVENAQPAPQGEDVVAQGQETTPKNTPVEPTPEGSEQAES